MKLYLAVNALPSKSGETHPFPGANDTICPVSAQKTRARTWGTQPLALY
jgi:hypothetical protein